MSIKKGIFIIFLLSIFFLSPMLTLAEDVSQNPEVDYGLLEEEPAIDNSLLEENEDLEKEPLKEGDRLLSEISEKVEEIEKEEPKNEVTRVEVENTKTPTSKVTSAKAPLREPASTSEWSEGKIRLAFGWVRPDAWRNSMQAPAGASLGWVNLPYYANGSAELLDSEGTVIESYTNEADHVFTGLKAGTYTIRLTIMDKGIYNIVESIVNGSSGKPDHLITTYESTVEVVEGNTNEILRWVVLEYKAYGYKTTTEIGTFKNGTTEKVYYKGGNWAYPNTDPSSVAKNPTFSTHNGIYYGDSADLYSGMNALEIPTLSAEEQKKGYVFKGWKLSGDDSGKIYTQEEALAHVVRTNVEFTAVWDYPTHTVKFSTNTTFGLINGQGFYSYTMDFNDGVLTEIPDVEALEGYEFVGWFSDLTTNVIPDSELHNTIVDKDLNFYAKYRRKTYTHVVNYLPGENGYLEGTDHLVLKRNSFIPTVPTVNPNEGYSFTGYWRVANLNGETDLFTVDSVLNEVQISRLQVTFDVDFEALYEEEKIYDDVYTVTYLDGCDGESFGDLTYYDLYYGEETPLFEIEPEREGYKFLGWTPNIEEYVYEDATYVAQWEKICPECNQKEEQNNVTPINNKVEKETISTINNNPQTLDQVEISFIFLILSVVGIFTSINFIKKQRLN